LSSLFLHVPSGFLTLFWAYCSQIVPKFEESIRTAD
jgi:hypothetical protein